MNVLADTHLLLWAMTGCDKLSSRARQILEDGENDCFFSAASIWEIALKRRNHADEIPMKAEEVRHFCLQSGLRPLAISPVHAAVADDLPPVHDDPFDRMLVAQAKVEGMMLLTHDGRLPAYGDWIVKA